MGAAERRALASLRANRYSRCRCASKHRTVEAWMRCALADRGVRFARRGGDAAGPFMYHHVCVDPYGSVWNDVDLFATLEAATVCLEAERKVHIDGKCSGTCEGLGTVARLGARP